MTGYNAKLGRECFAAVSRQMVEYMKLHDIEPRKQCVHKMDIMEDTDQNNVILELDDDEDELDGFGPQNSEFLTQNSGFGTQDSGFTTQTTEFRTQNSGLYRKRNQNVVNQYSSRSSVYSMHKSYSMDSLNMNSADKTAERCGSLHYSLSSTSLNRAVIGPSCPTCGSAINISA